jgi:single-strand DNA-binding protein
MKNYSNCSGNLVADPEVQVTTTGRKVTNFRIAVDSRIKDRETGKYVKKEGAPADFYKVSIWGDLGEKAAAELKKGDLVAFKGELSAKAWTDKEGKAHTDMEMTAREYNRIFAKEQSTAPKDLGEPELETPQQKPPKAAKK